MTVRKERIFPLLLGTGALAFAFTGACLALSKSFTAFADAPALPEIGRLELEQTDALGEKVSVPVEFDGEQYILKDTVRNIYVFDASRARSESEILNNNFPIYTSENGVFEDGMAISIYANTIKAYDFYTSENIGVDFYGVNGKNDQTSGNLNDGNEEMPFFIYVHFNAAGIRYNAAYTPLEDKNASAMVVGDGSTNTTYDLYRQGTALDVIAHEYQHGISQFTAGFTYEEDSGALNEAISDIFGALIEGHDPSEEEFWLMGEDCSVTGSSMRSIKNPQEMTGRNKSGQTLSDKYTCSGLRRHVHTQNCDYGGVHFNSTIISHLQYTAYTMDPDYFTRERIARLWFETLLHLNAQTTFLDFAKEFRSAAVSLQYEEKAIDAIDYSLFVNGFPTSGMFHKVTFINEDGSILANTVVKHGESAEAPENPVKAPTEANRYIFEGWDKTFDRVLEDLEVRAIFRTESRDYAIEFLDDQGKLFKRLENVPYSEVDVAKSTENITPPVKENTAQYSYTFERWETDIDEQMGKITITPVYQEKLRSYTVSYQFHGEEYYSVTQPYGTLELIDLPEGCLGWYVDKDCTIAAQGRMLDKNLTIYGKAEHDFAPYIIALFSVGVAVLAGSAIAAVIIVKKKKGKRF